MLRGDTNAIRAFDFHKSIEFLKPQFLIVLLTLDIIWARFWIYQYFTKPILNKIVGMKPGFELLSWH